jgi:pyruvate ferredoxin oxidoreductase alpha subunit
MVCVDGFTLTHAFERIELPEQEQVDRFLPPFAPRQRLDPDAPMTIGALVGPEAFTEVRYLADRQLRHALDAIPRLSAELGRELGRECPGLVRGYRLDGADTVVVAQGSVVGTLLEVVDDLRAAGVHAGVLAIGTYRPFPVEAVRSALTQAARVVVIDRALATGTGGFLAADVRPALAPGTSCTAVVAGLGGRPVTRQSLRRLLDGVANDDTDETIFLDLNRDLIREQVNAQQGGKT